MCAPAQQLPGSNRLQIVPAWLPEASRRKWGQMCGPATEDIRRGAEETRMVEDQGEGGGGGDETVKGIEERKARKSAGARTREEVGGGLTIAEEKGKMVLEKGKG